MDMKAVVAIGKCTREQKVYGIRLEQSGKNWMYTWAFPINERAAAREGFDKTKIEGTLVKGEEFPDCPHCKAQSFFVCDNCRKINCWNGTDKAVQCAWCSNKGEIQDGEVDNVEITGNI